MVILTPEINSGASPSFEDFEYDYVLGIMQMVISLLFLLIYIPVVMSYLHEVRSKWAISFTLMIFQAISDILQLLVHLFVGFSIAIKYRKGRLFRVLGALVKSGWFAMLGFTLLITIYRFTTIVFNRFSMEFFTKTVMWISIGSNILLGVLFFVVLQTDLGALYYDFSRFCWYYPDMGYNTEFEFFDECVMMFACTMAIVLYIVLFVYVFSKKANFNRKDLKLPLQTFFLCVFMLLVYIEWKYVYENTPATAWSRFLQEMLWPIWNGVTPTLYLIFKRKRMKKQTIVVGLPVRSSTQTPTQLKVLKKDPQKCAEFADNKS